MGTLGSPAPGLNEEVTNRRIGVAKVRQRATGRDDDSGRPAGRERIHSIVIGGADIAPKHAVEMFRTIPHSHLCVVPNAGHGVLPKETVLTFLNESSAQTSSSAPAAWRNGTALPA